MNGKIFVAYHFTPKPGQVPRDELYEPLIMENYVSSDYTKGECPPDDRKFDAFESMKWDIWKHHLGNHGWIGLYQYRRGLVLEPNTPEDIDKLALQHDIITGAPEHGANMNMKSQFIDCHGSVPWFHMEDILGVRWAYDSQLIPHGGLGCMRREIFVDLMEQQENLVQALIRRGVKAPMTPFRERRLYGFLLERFFSLYLYRLKLERPETVILFRPLTPLGEQHLS